MNSIELRVDADHDVLYAKRLGARIHLSDEAPTDSFLILNRDADGDVVGVQFLAVNEMELEYWRHHPDRGFLPADILAALDGWMAARR